MTSPHFNPFPGLRPFRVEEEYLFFGREQQRRELVGLLRQQRFIGVLGASGSGKSSLVRAGLLPALYGGVMTRAGSHWNIAMLRPGGAPIRNLAEAFLMTELWEEWDHPPSSLELETNLARSGLGLVEAVRQARMPANQNLLVVVDQFEELFRFQQSRARRGTRDEAAAFVNLLLEATRQKEWSIHVVLTMRSDFFGDCSQFEGLAEAINQGEYLVPRLTRAQKKQAIEGPVKVGGGQVSPRLLQRLLGDLGDDPDQLPVLQHALMRTWDHWASDHAKGEPLDLRHYEGIGGMAEALSRHADEVYASLQDESHRLLAAKIFKSLTERGADNRGIRRPTSLRSLCAVTGAPEESVRRVVDAFRQTGCTFLMPPEGVSLEPNTVVDLSHESLMRVWVRLKSWVEEESQSARIYQRLADTAQLRGEGKAGLYHHPDLQIALSWHESSQPTHAWAARYHQGFDSAMAFLDESRKAELRKEKEREEARRRELEQVRLLAETQARVTRGFKRFGFAMAALLILAMGLAVWAIDANKRAQRQADEMRLRSYDAGILNAIYLQDTINNSGRALQALTNCPVEMRDWEWRQLKATVDQTERVVASGLEGVFIAVFSPDGSKVLSGRRTGLYQLWEVATGRELNRFEMGPSAMNEKLPDPAFMPDGRQVVLCDETRMIVWDTLTAQPLQTYTPMRPLAVFVGTNRFLSLHRPLGNAVTNAQVWDHAAGRLLSVLTPNTRGSRTSIFSPDGTRVAFRDLTPEANVQQRIFVVDPSTGEQLYEFQEDWVALSELALSSRGVLAMCDPFSRINLYDLQTGESLANLSTSGNYLMTLAFRHNGSHFVTGGSQGILWLFDVASGVILGTFRGHGSMIRSVRYSQDDQWIVSTSDDGTIRLWQSEPYDSTLFQFSEFIIQNVAVSPDSKEFATISTWRFPRNWQSGIVTIQDMATHDRRQCYWDPKNRARELAYSPDGRWFVTLHADGLTLKRRDRQRDYQESRLEPPPTKIKKIAFAADDVGLIGWGDGPDFYVWNLWNGELDRPVPLGVSGSDLSDVALSSRGTRFALSFQNNEGIILIRDLMNGKLIRELQDLPAQIQCLAFSPDGQWLAAGGSDHLARVWELTSGKLLHRFEGHNDAITAVDFSLSGRRLATGSSDTSVRLWNMETGKEMMGWSPNVGAVQRLIFNPDGNALTVLSDPPGGSITFIEAYLPDRDSRVERRMDSRLVPKIEPFFYADYSPEVLMDTIARDPDLDAKSKNLVAMLCKLIQGLTAAESTGEPFEAFIPTLEDLNEASTHAIMQRYLRFSENTEKGMTEQAWDDWEFLKAQPEAYLYSAHELLLHFARRFLADIMKQAQTNLSADEEIKVLAILLYHAYQAQEFLAPAQETVLDLVRKVQSAARIAPLTRTLVPKGAVWKFLDDGTDQGQSWRQPDFADASWNEGPADFGLEDDANANAKTRVRYGGDSGDKFTTTYFRHQFLWNPDPVYDQLHLGLRRDDGAVVYLNGKEVVRDNMPNGRIRFVTFASSTVGDADERAYFTFSLPATLLQPATNVLAVEIHQVNPSSSDLHFDLELTIDRNPLGYLGTLSDDQLQTAVSQVRAWLPQALQGSWMNLFEFSLAADPAAFGPEVQSNIDLWETRARIQLAMRHDLLAAEACQTALDLLAKRSTSPETDSRIQEMEQLLQQANLDFSPEFQ